MASTVSFVVKVFTLQEAALVRDALGDKLCELRRGRKAGAPVSVLPIVEALHHDMTQSVMLAKD